MDKIGYLCYCRFQISMNKKVCDFEQLTQSEKKAWEDVATQCFNHARVELAGAQLIDSALNDARKHNEQFEKVKVVE